MVLYPVWYSVLLTHPVVMVLIFIWFKLELLMASRCWIFVPAEHENVQKRRYVVTVFLTSLDVTFLGRIGNDVLSSLRIILDFS